MNSIQERGKNFFNDMGRIDKIGVACLAIYVILLVLSLLLGLLGQLFYRLPSFFYPVADVLYTIESFASSFLTWLLIIGIILVLLGGPRRRRAVLFAPVLVWKAIKGVSNIIRLGRRGELAEATGGAIGGAIGGSIGSRRARREQVEIEQIQADLIHRIDDGMTRAEFDAEVDRIIQRFSTGQETAAEMQEARADLEEVYTIRLQLFIDTLKSMIEEGMPREDFELRLGLVEERLGVSGLSPSEIEQQLSALEDDFEEYVRLQERREARDRRRAGQQPENDDNEDGV